MLALSRHPARRHLNHSQHSRTFNPQARPTGPVRRMRLVRKNIDDSDYSGSITFCPQEPEDMWHAYNLVASGDRVRSAAVRKIVSESHTGSTKSERVHTILTIRVQKIDFDPQSCALHLSGPCVEENPYVMLGQFHTLDLELNRNFTLTKAEWDSVALDTVNEACDAKERSEIGAVVLQEGFANVCNITQHMTVKLQKVTENIPHKRQGHIEGYQKGLSKFYDNVYRALLHHYDFGKLKVILLASPGFVAEDLRKYIFLKAVQEDQKALVAAKPKFVVVHSSSGHLHSLNEALQSPAVQKELADTKFARETRAIDDFFAMMNKDEDRAWYGMKPVEKAVDKGAVGTLLISDEIFRSDTISERKRWVKVVEDVKRGGGEVMVLSSIHESGVRLGALGGIAAILTYPELDLDESDEEEEEEDDEEEVET